MKQKFKLNDNNYKLTQVTQQYSFVHKYQNNFPPLLTIENKNNEITQTRDIECKCTKR